MTSYKLSAVERLMIANQFRMLAKLDGEYSTHHGLEEKITILEQGYEGSYGEVLGIFCEAPMSAEEMRYTNDVLLMMTNILDHQEGLGEYDLSGIRTVGFDGNHETRELGYAKFLFEDSFNNFPGIEAVVNSHFPTRKKYSGMIEVYQKAIEGGRFELEDARRVLDAGNFKADSSD